MVDYEKCEKCTMPVSYCDGTTRYKCGSRKDDVGSHCTSGE